ncbi:MAG: hypothetical protein V2A67_11440 [Bacteroidota bacterium]
MKLISVYIAALVLGGISFSCSKEKCHCEKDQPVLFQYEYINYAWGYRHHGFMISPDGVIHGFRQPAEWKEYDSTGLISSANLEYNLNRCDTVFGTVDTDTLNAFFNQIEEIRNGEIKDIGVYMADAGTGVFLAWYWNSDESMYERVFLISNGDTNLENTNAKVDDLVEWLKRTGQKTDRFYWFGNQ